MSKRFGRRMPRGRRPVFLAAAGALVLTPLATPAASAAPSVPATADAGPVDEVRAAEAARASGRRVEVTANRTETETLYANPDGSWTLDLTNEPIRVRRGDGWADIDPTLVRRPDGTVAPVATVLDMTLSGGGTAPLAVLAKDGNSLALSWPRALPEPVLSGPTATYAEVLPGVDLVVTASAEGFSEVLVVKNRAAALNPALRRVAFGAKPAGLTLRPDAAGGFTALDAAGLPALVAPEATMWDSRGGDAPGHAKAAREGDRVAKMRTEVSQSSIAIVPDAAMLADPSTTYPLYLDPTILNASHTSWAMVDEYYPSNEYYKFASDEGVGYQNFSGVSKKRQFHAFTTSALAGADVSDAKFKAFETHAASCTATEVELWRVGNITSGTNWSNQPGWYSYVSNAVVAYGRDGCPTYPAGGWVEFEADAAAQVAADTNSATLTFGLKAGSETSSSYWKRFRYDAQLSVTYNRTPTVSGLRIASPSKTCTTGTGRAWISDPTPTLAATLNDADDDNTRATFEYGQIGGTRYTSAWTAFKATPSEHQFTTPTLDGDPTTAYSWRVKANDNVVTSAYSGLCEFYLDTVVPAPPTATSDNFPAGAASTTHFVGDPGTFTLKAGTTTSDTDYFKYSFDSDAYNLTSNPTTLNADGVISYTPLQAGVHFLMVKSYDRASNVNTMVEKYVFRIGNHEPSGRWRFDENTGLTAADSTTNARTATLSSTGATWAQGRWWEQLIDETDYALALDGTGTAQTVSGSIDTSKPFSVGVWVDVNKANLDTGRYVAVSQNSVNTSSYQVGYENGVWFFKMAQTDTGTTAWSYASTSANGMTQRWVHLTAIYDGLELRLSVYDPVSMSATSATPVPHTSTFTSSAPVRIGAGRSTGLFVGRIDEVVTYPGVLGPDDIGRLQTQPHAQS